MTGVEAAVMEAMQVGGPSGGSGLDVAQAIGRYLDRANGDTRLALAFSVADGLVFSRMVSGAVPPSVSERRSATQPPPMPPDVNHPSTAGLLPDKVIHRL